MACDDRGLGEIRRPCRADAGPRDGHVSVPGTGGLDLGQIARLSGLSASGSAGAPIRNVRARVNAGNDGLGQDINMILNDLTP